jgi:hypothetical protein
MPKLIQHKPTATCPITAPHDEAICGLVRTRHRRSAEMNAAIDQQTADERQRAGLDHSAAPTGG